jgi:hypothetical protein
MTKNKEMQNVIHYYQDQTGKTEFDMEDVVKFAVLKLGWKLPEPESPYKRLAKSFSQAAREEIKYDPKTGNPYRVNHHINIKQGDQNLSLWFSIEKANRKQMVKSLIGRREQMVADGLQLTYDQDYWNSINPNEKEIQMVMDFAQDIEERKFAAQMKKKAA